MKIKSLLILTALATLILAAKAQANDITELQRDIGTDKIAHFFAGSTCSFILVDRVFTDENPKGSFGFLTSKRFRKAKAAVICTAIAYTKEQIDTKSDWKDFGATTAGVMVPLMTWKW